MSTQNSKKYWIIHFCGRIPELFKAKILLLWRIGPAQQYVRMTSTVLRFLPNYYFTYLLIHIPTIARFISFFMLKITSDLQLESLANTGDSSVYQLTHACVLPLHWSIGFICLYNIVSFIKHSYFVLLLVSLETEEHWRHWHA